MIIYYKHFNIEKHMDRILFISKGLIMREVVKYLSNERSPEFDYIPTPKVLSTPTTIKILSDNLYDNTLFGLLIPAGEKLFRGNKEPIQILSADDVLNIMLFEDSWFRDYRSSKLKLMEIDRSLLKDMGFTIGEGLMKDAGQMLGFTIDDLKEWNNLPVPGEDIET